MQEYDVAVIFGGVSNENEISIITGTLACNVLIKGGKSVLPIFVSQQGKMYAGESLADINRFKGDGYLSAFSATLCDKGVLLFNGRGKLKKRVSINCVLNCCHGGYGEGGGVCGLCALNNLPLAGAGLFESSVFMDKYYTKLILKSLGVEVAPYVYLRDMAGVTAKAEGLGYPVIVKPCKLGSSIGVVKADDGEQLILALKAAFTLDDGAIIEKYLENRREINCAAYLSDDKVVVSECEEAKSEGDLLSYDDKYAGKGKSVFPAEIDKKLSDKIKKTTQKVYSALNMRGITRFDYIISGGKVYLSEVNTVPGSLSYYLLSSGFDDFYNVLEKVIAQAMLDWSRAGEKMLINTGILNNFSSNACKIK